MERSKYRLIGDISEFHYVTNDFNLGLGKKFLLLLKMAIFSTLEPIFSKGCTPMGVKIFFLKFSTYLVLKGLRV